MLNREPIEGLSIKAIKNMEEKMLNNDYNSG